MLGSYGTGAVMAVPAHDERDFAFAQAFGLGIRRVVQPADEEKGDGDGVALNEAFTGKGVAVNSGEVGGLFVRRSSERDVSVFGVQAREGVCSISWRYRGGGLDSRKGGVLVVWS